MEVQTCSSVHGCPVQAATLRQVLACTNEHFLGSGRNYRASIRANRASAAARKIRIDSSGDTGIVSLTLTG